MHWSTSSIYIYSIKLHSVKGHVIALNLQNFSRWVWVRTHPPLKSVIPDKFLAIILSCMFCYYARSTRIHNPFLRYTLRRSLYPDVFSKMKLISYLNSGFDIILHLLHVFSKLRYFKRGTERDLSINVINVTNITPKNRENVIKIVEICL